jgi:hypothetical protein
VFIGFLRLSECLAVLLFTVVEFAGECFGGLLGLLSSLLATDAFRVWGEIHILRQIVYICGRRTFLRLMEHSLFCLR